MLLLHKLTNAHRRQLSSLVIMINLFRARISHIYPGLAAKERVMTAEINDDEDDDIISIIIILCKCSRLFALASRISFPCSVLLVK